VPPADRLDQSDGARNRARRVFLEAEGEREVEEDLGVGRALDLGVEGGIDLEHEVALASSRAEPAGASIPGRARRPSPT
jgi:hypothetical protein